ncbi:RNA polymerase sigma factor [Micromonospora sp. IBHARD004]|uniref:RNA polymerase sigma factor n=1 Tax=Micromonospora sp. IBHARD004 TaxID=3457764 RepID=UPI004058447A
MARADARSVPDDLSYLPAPGDQLLGADIAQSLANLTPEHRAVLVLRDLEGYSEQETAELLRVSPLESWRVALCGLVLKGAGG